MPRMILGVGLLLSWFAGDLAAQSDVGPLRERSRNYLGCYELRLFDWNDEEGRDAAESIPDRLMLTPTTLPPNGRDAEVALDMALGPFPGYGPSDFVDERWSLSSATDSVVVTWSNESAGVRAVLAMVGSVGSWRFTGRAEAWDQARVVAGQPETPALRGRAAGRSVDCDR